MARPVITQPCHAVLRMKVREFGRNKAIFTSDIRDAMAFAKTAGAGRRPRQHRPRLPRRPRAFGARSSPCLTRSCSSSTRPVTLNEGSQW
jgi:hypothetical protein